MSSLHYTGERLRILVEDMSFREHVSLTPAMWQEAVKLVRLGALSSCDNDVSFRLILLILNKCRRDNPIIKAISFRIFLLILLNINNKKREFIEERLRQIVFLMLRSTVRNAECPDSMSVRTLAEDILFKIFRQIIRANSSFEVLLDAYNIRPPDVIVDADYPKYFHWIVDKAEEDEINREHINNFLTMLERRWTVKREYDRRRYEALLKDMQHKFRHNLLQDENKCFARLLQRSSDNKDNVLEKDDNDPLAWVNYNNWTIPRYWIAKHQKKEENSKRHTSSPNRVQFIVKNTHNAEAPSAPTAPSITSSYCSDCLDKQRREFDEVIRMMERK